MAAKVPSTTISETVLDPESGRTYRKGKFLGKGGFAKCYELTDMATNDIYAGKIVPKSLLVKPHQKEKMAQEIDIHRGLSHKHIVGFHGFFEDSENIYILLELCRRRSLMELHKRRKALTEPEVRYLFYQMLLAVSHLHLQKIIHRDLKLGNLLLNDDLEIKLGDFGLATRVEVDGEKKRTLCGTPNYIAPEVLCKKGHSYEVDVWSMGCVLYTLLVGKPPFETNSLNDTYRKIKRNEYHIPSRIGREANVLITKLLRPNPMTRPTTEEILKDPFFTSGYRPERLPVSCLTTAPHFKSIQDSRSGGMSSRRPLGGHNPPAIADPSPLPSIKPSSSAAATPSSDIEGLETVPADWYLGSLIEQIVSCLSSKPTEKPHINYAEAEDPAAMPVFWVSKWVDYTDKYGLGYQLCDDSVGVLFNDCTKLILGADGESMQYIDRNLSEQFLRLSVYPENMYKKVTLLKYFRNYMSEHLLKAGGTLGEREVDEGVRLPYLRTWTRTKSAIILHLSNGTLQMNFFHDHTKIFICPLMQAVTYIDESKVMKSYPFKSIEQFGCSKEIAKRLQCAKSMAEKLLQKLDPEEPRTPMAAAPIAMPTVQVPQ